MVVHAGTGKDQLILAHDPGLTLPARQPGSSLSAAGINYRLIERVKATKQLDSHTACC
jgi:hypothetical protein